MKNTMSQYDFVNWFANSQERKNQFSREALFALFDYLEQYEEDCGEEIEFDPIALCCEYTEYATAVDCIKDRGGDLKDLDIDWEDEEEAKDEDLIEEKAIEYLENDTTVIEFDGGIIIQDF